MTATITPINQNLQLVLDENETQNICEWDLLPADNGNLGKDNLQVATEVILKANSTLNYVMALGMASTKGAELTSLQKKMRFVLEEGSSLNFIGIFFGKNHSEHKIKTFIDHIGPHSRSNIQVKGALQDKAFNSFQGLVKIDKSAPQSNAHLEQRVLLLSKEASCEGQPELEILNNDVKASHAAVVGKLSDDQLFYMESRGIDQQVARQMILKGFFASLIAQIVDVDLKKKIKDTFLKSF